MKRIKLLPILLLTLLLTACGTSAHDKDIVVKALDKKGYIAGTEEIDMMKRSDQGIIPNSESYYIYADDDGNLSAVTFGNVSGHYNYAVTVYSDVSLNEDVRYVDSSTKLNTGMFYYTRSEDAYSMAPSYDIRSGTKYLATRESFLGIFDYYVFEEDSQM